MIVIYMLFISISSSFSFSKRIFTTTESKYFRSIFERVLPKFQYSKMATSSENVPEHDDPILTQDHKSNRKQNMKRKRPDKADVAMAAQYQLEKLSNGLSVRHVVPYIQEFRTFAKGRWIGREIIEVLSTEFGSHPLDYWTRAIANGYVKVNKAIVSSNAKIRNSDEILHKTHRHEPPVFGDLTLVGDSPTLLAVCKPASMPMHPCGSYRYNSLEYILHNDPSFASWTKNPNLSNKKDGDGEKEEGGTHTDTPTLAATEQESENRGSKKSKVEKRKGKAESGGVGRLHIVHRLDRVTSGLVVLARTKEVAAELSEIIRQKGTEKIYLARVRGFFPNRPPALQRLQKIDLKFFDIDFDTDLDPAHDHSEQAEGSSKREPSAVGIGKKDKHRFGRGEVVNVLDLPTTGKTAPLLDEVRASSGVGYVLTTANEWGKKTTSQTIQANGRELLVDASDLEEVGDVWVTCPIGVVSHKEGVYACDPLEGKPCLSRFRRLWYCPATDTSLVECSPYTGRTHQLRLHLQLCGHPIANDPCYGGTLFFNDFEKRDKAVAALQYMKVHSIIPLSKVPHFDGAELVASPPHTVEQVGSGLVAEVKEELEPPSDSSDMKQRIGEADDDYLVRTCRYCKASEKLGALEQLLHCDGIWLHALRYIGPDWDFKTPYPAWAIKNS